MEDDTDARYGATWRATLDLLGILSSSGRFQHTNPAWFRTLGWTAPEIESRHFTDFLHPADIARSEAAFEQIQRGEPVLSFENRYRHKDGSYRWLSWNAVPEEGRFFCSARDITQAKSDSAELKSRKQEAHLREQFVAILGHDLRNPLAAIAASHRLLLKEDVSERGKQVLQAAGQSIDRMAALIDDIMDFTKTRLGGGLDVDLSRVFSLEEPLREVVDEMRMANPGILVSTHFDFREPIRCDELRMKQMLSNLLGNAVSHGTKGAPIEVSALDDGEHFILSVANQGEPIDPDMLDKLFEPFVREEVRPSRQGVGLGLFICAEIARAHNGRLDVSSSTDCTRFTFKMPH